MRTNNRKGPEGERYVSGMDYPHKPKVYASRNKKLKKKESAVKGT